MNYIKFTYVMKRLTDIIEGILSRLDRTVTAKFLALRMSNS